MEYCEKCGHPEYACICGKNDKAELPVDNIVFWVEDKKFSFWNSVELFGAFETANEFMKREKMIHPKTPYRIVKEEKTIVG